MVIFPSIVALNKHFVTVKKNKEQKLTVVMFFQVP